MNAEPRGRRVHAGSSTPLQSRAKNAHGPTDDTQWLVSPLRPVVDAVSGIASRSNRSVEKSTNDGSTNNSDWSRGSKNGNKKSSTTETPNRCTAMRNGNRSKRDDYNRRTKAVGTRRGRRTISISASTQVSRRTFVRENNFWITLPVFLGNT
ncbi:hypothetical protein AAE478_000314 [Parahypoxylon ruwenzoriense]